MRTPEPARLLERLIQVTYGTHLDKHHSDPGLGLHSHAWVPHPQAEDFSMIKEAQELGLVTISFPIHQNLQRKLNDQIMGNSCFSTNYSLKKKLLLLSPALELE